MEEETVLDILKIVFMVGFVAVVIIVGSLPIRLKTFKANKFLKTMGTTFAGSLFLNVSILHILPQSADTIEKYLQDGDDQKDVFPLAYLLMVGGFLITIFFTKIISTHSHSHSHEEEREPQANQTLLSKDSLVREQKNDKQVQCTHQHDAKQINDPYFLTAAMYFHTIFEGIAIGVQNSIAKFLSTAVAIAFHKWADALSMGIHYRNNNVAKRKAYGLIIGQAALNFIAIGFGWFIDSFGQMVEAVFLSISAGTFLAISTMEMLGESLNEKQYKFYKFFILLLSTGIISLVWFLENAIFSQ